MSRLNNERLDNHVQPSLDRGTLKEMDEADEALSSLDTQNPVIRSRPNRFQPTTNVLNVVRLPELRAQNCDLRRVKCEDGSNLHASVDPDIAIQNA